MYRSWDDDLIKINGTDILLLLVGRDLKANLLLPISIQEYLEFLLQICPPKNQNLFIKILCPQ